MPAAKGKLLEEPTGGQVAPTMAYMNKSPLKGGLTWAQCELVKIDCDEACASYSGGGQGDVPTVRGGKRRHRPPRKLPRPNAPYMPTAGCCCRPRRCTDLTFRRSHSSPSPVANSRNNPGRRPCAMAAADCQEARLVIDANRCSGELAALLVHGVRDIMSPCLYWEAVALALQAAIAPSDADKSACALVLDWANPSSMVFEHIAAN